jgi:hypothetical protein
MKEPKLIRVSAAVSSRKVEQTENSIGDISDVSVSVLKHSAFGIPEIVIRFQSNIGGLMGRIDP